MNFPIQLITTLLWSFAITKPQEFPNNTTCVQRIDFHWATRADPAFFHNWWECIVGSSCTMQVPFRKLFSILVPYTFYAMHWNWNWARANCCARRRVCVCLCCQQCAFVRGPCRVATVNEKKGAKCESLTEQKSMERTMRETQSKTLLLIHTNAKAYTHISMVAIDITSKNSPVEWQTIDSSAFFHTYFDWISPFFGFFVVLNNK